MKKESLIYSERGGYTVAESFWGEGSSATWPFAKLEIFKDKIILWYVLNKVEFKKSEIKYIGFLENGWGPLIRIYHKKKNVRPYILFHSFRPRKLLEKIRRAGYKIKL